MRKDEEEKSEKDKKGKDKKEEQEGDKKPGSANEGGGSKRLLLGGEEGRFLVELKYPWMHATLEDAPLLRIAGRKDVGRRLKYLPWEARWRAIDGPVGQFVIKRRIGANELWARKLAGPLEKGKKEKDEEEAKKSEGGGGKDGAPGGGGAAALRPAKGTPMNTTGARVRLRLSKGCKRKAHKSRSKVT